MKLVNADQGIDMVRTDKQEKWWCHHRFPLLPMWDYRRGDEWNEDSWSFTWLFIRYWSLPNFSFRAEIELDERGIGVGLILPYTRLWFWILPLPLSFFWKLRRKTRGEKEQERDALNLKNWLRRCKFDAGGKVQ